MLFFVVTCLVYREITIVSSQNVTVVEPTIEISQGSNVTLEWTLKKSEDYNTIIRVNVVRKKMNGESEKIAFGAAAAAIFPPAKRSFKGRLSADIATTGDLTSKLGEKPSAVKYQVTISNVQYDDTGSYNLEAGFEKSRKELLVYLNKTIIFEPVGPPEVQSNSTRESKLTHTLSGVPTPKVTWGFMKNETFAPLQHQTHRDKYYLHDYSVNIKSNMCGKTFYFKAVGYNNQKKEWSIKPDIESDLSKIHNITLTTDSDINIYWTKVDFGSCAVEYDVLFFRGLKNKPVQVLHQKKSNSVHCKLDECKDITHIELRIRLDGVIKSLGKYSITKPKTGVVDPTVPPHKPKPTDGSSMSIGVVLACVIGVLVLAVLIFLVVICRRRSQHQKASALNDYENIPITGGDVEMANIPLTTKKNVENEYMLYESVSAQSPEDQTNLYDAVADGQKREIPEYAKVDKSQKKKNGHNYINSSKSKENEMPEYALVDKSAKNEIPEYGVVDVTPNGYAEAGPGYAKVDKTKTKNKTPTYAEVDQSKNNATSDYEVVDKSNNSSMAGYCEIDNAGTKNEVPDYAEADTATKNKIPEYAIVDKSKKNKTTPEYAKVDKAKGKKAHDYVNVDSSKKNEGLSEYPQYEATKSRGIPDYSNLKEDQIPLYDAVAEGPEKEIPEYAIVDKSKKKKNT